MATLVPQILEQSRSIAATELGATYQRLAFIYDLSKLDIRRGRLAYGIRPLSAVPSSGIVRAFTLDHEFELILTDTIARGLDDSQRETAIDVMYDKADELMKLMINTKINLSNFVIHVFQPSISEPEFFDDNKVVALRTQYIVKYRSLL